MNDKKSNSKASKGLALLITALFAAVTMAGTATAAPPEPELCPEPRPGDILTYCIRISSEPEELNLVRLNSNPETETVCIVAGVPCVEVPVVPSLLLPDRRLFATVEVEEARVGPGGADPVGTGCRIVFGTASCKLIFAFERSAAGSNEPIGEPFLALRSGDAVFPLQWSSSTAMGEIDSVGYCPTPRPDDMITFCLRLSLEGEESVNVLTPYGDPEYEEVCVVAPVPCVRVPQLPSIFITQKVTIVTAQVEEFSYGFNGGSGMDSVCRIVTGNDCDRPPTTIRIADTNSDGSWDGILVPVEDGYVLAPWS